MFFAFLYYSTIFWVMLGFVVAAFVILVFPFLMLSVPIFYLVPFKAILSILLILVLVKMVIKYFKISKRNSSYKVLDSSVFVDGRIVDLIRYEFLEGPFIIPKFIISELHRLSDSDNAQRRMKGRLALDNIATIQNIPNINVFVDRKDYKIRDVDTKLIRLAKRRGAKILTTDFNLSKVADIEFVRVLNINTLSSLIKKIILPNEEFEIELVKKGDKEGQSVGYLEDGTMVVVTDGGDRIGRRVKVLTVSTYPTQAGRIVFGRLK